jgi:hypothetical protein
MERKAMFGEIGRFAGRRWFEERRYGNLYYGGRDRGVEFFAFVHADAYDGAVFRAGVEGREARESYLGGLLAAAARTRDVPVTADDRIVLLSTCSASSTNGRDILVGRITDETYEDTFGTIGDGGVPTAGGAGAGIPPKAGIAVAGALLAALILLIKRRRARKGEAASARDAGAP